MTSTELAIADEGARLDLDMRYATVLAESDLVPRCYQGKPQNILIAMTLGASMGLSRTESMYRIDVIQGKPTAAAELIASNVRRAGHRLHTVINEDEQWAETTIWRRDDPENPIGPIRRDMAWAKRMGLSQKENYVKQPTTMLAYRSITACARLACSEALYGLMYTADELTDIDTSSPAPRAAQPAKKTDGGGFADRFKEVAPATKPTAKPKENDPVEETVDAEVVEDEPVETTEQAETGEALSNAQRSAIFAAFLTAGFEDNARTKAGQAQRCEYMSRVLGREVTSTEGMLASEADTILDALAIDAAEAGEPEGA